MRYDDPKLRQHLAGAYALGSLRGPARARFERLMSDDAELRRLVVEYQEDLMPLALATQEIRPPEEIRQRLADATAPRTKSEPGKSWWHWHSFWRGLAIVNGMVVIALIAFFGVDALRQEPPVSSGLVYVGVLSDANQKPGVAVLAYNDPFRLEIVTKTALTASATSEYHLWVRSDNKDTPVFLTTITANEKIFPLEETAWKRLRQAKSLMITREPPDSETTSPGEDVLYEGVCVNLRKWSGVAPASS